jgi:hypothetical protein
MDVVILKDVLIVVLIFAVVFGGRWAVRAAIDATVGRYAQTHVWVMFVVAAGLVVWAALDAVGVIHESPWRTMKTYFAGGIAAVMLILYGVGSLKKLR